jgi:hypothetical protein
VSVVASNVDFRGARGSNAGDQFHELWALQQVLELLKPGTTLTAVGVEGVNSGTPPQKDDDPTWDSVDCTLYFGGRSLETADKVEFVQLKYSSANPDKTWSVSRLTENTAKKKNNSVIRKLADDFKKAKQRLKQDTQLTIRFVSNQDISPELRKALGARWSGSLKKSPIDLAIKADLEKLIKASGITQKEFQHFLNALDCSECGSLSRFAHKEKAISAVAQLLGDDVSSEIRDLQQRVRELMLPDRSQEVVTEHVIFSWFGLSGREGLFPCPHDIQQLEKAVSRSAVDDVIRLLTNGERLVLVHGAGGCGKTTLMRQIADRLPNGSVTVFFDCFGAGRYLHTDDKRHLPENAFLQLTNDLALALDLPLFVPRSLKNPANIKSFIQKLRAAGETLSQIAPSGLLSIIVDAADNAVTAAMNSNPPEKAFVHDLFNADLSNLSGNVRFLISCRTDTTRRDSLKLPLRTPEIICQPFTLAETTQHLKNAFTDLDACLVEQFHYLSNQNPRVQAYAIAAAKGDATQLLESLLPGGKSLSDILHKTIDNALFKLGQRGLFESLVGSLALLPPPVAVPALARISKCGEDTVRDFILDLTPGLRLHGNEVTVADEDIDTFISDSSTAKRTEIIAAIAEDFIETFHSDPYSSLHIADALIHAGRSRDILSVIEQDPHVEAVSDPIVRRQVQIRRLKLSLAACQEAGSTSDALKTILNSAEAEHDDSTLSESLEKDLDLSVEFAGASLRRAILHDPERIELHGSFLAQDAVRAIRAGDRATAREQLYFYSAWLERRREIEDKERRSWTVSDYDISARVEAILEFAGSKEAIHDLLRWRPRDIALRVAFILIPQLIASGKIKHVNKILQEFPPHTPWNLLLLVPLAMAGGPVEGDAVEKSLKHLRKRLVPDINEICASHKDEGWQQSLLDTFITACELAFKLNVSNLVVLSALDTILSSLEGTKTRRLYLFDVCRIDGLFRCWLLRELITGREANVEDFIAYTTSLNPEPEPVAGQGKKGRKERSADRRPHDRDTEKINKKVKALYPVYAARIDILNSAKRGSQVSASQLDKLSKIASHAYDFDYDHESSKLRVMTARSVMCLLIVESIKAVELEKRASTLTKGRYSDSFSSNRLTLWSRMSLRGDEAEELIKLISAATENIKALRESSSSKLEALICLSRLVLPISRDDAASIFNDAVSIAKEIDLEAFDQIDIMSALADRARVSGRQERNKISNNIAAFVSGVSDRLSGYDYFPWQSAVHALTCIDDTAGLAAICRWADDGTVSLSETLDQYLLTALHRGTISLEAAFSLSWITEGPGGHLRKELVCRATEGRQKNSTIVEELAKEILLFNSQQSRLKLGEEIVSLVSDSNKLGGEWLAHLNNTVKFLKDNNINEEEDAAFKDLNPTRSVGWNCPPPEFDFEPQGKAFTTPEAIAEILQDAKTSGLRHSDSDLLRKMREVTHPRDRIAFLNALATLPDEVIWGATRVDTISETIDIWKGTPAIKRWCKETLPSVIVTHFYAAARWLKEGNSCLHRLLDHAGINSYDRLEVIFAGVSEAGENLSSRTLFAIAEEIARYLDVDEAGRLLGWYSSRLLNRLPEEDRPFPLAADLPRDTTEAVARFLFALMGDIDTRIRWRAAHALRCLAKIECTDIVGETVRQLNQRDENAFRDPEAPFYFLAAKLWLLISLCRISVENPMALYNFKDHFLGVAVTPDLPHVAIQEYAKRTLTQLETAGVIMLTPSEKAQIDNVNNAPKGITEEERDYHRSFGRGRDVKRRFNFDDTDTIRYWYEDILRIFPTVSQEEVLTIAEKWIVDRWGVDENANWWDKEPRKARYNERRYMLWSHSHGSFPIIERYGTHLEWNAMYCVVGELLETHPVSGGDENEYGSLSYWLARVLPTEQPQWISDHRGPTPLEMQFWKNDPKADKWWIQRINRTEILAKMGLSGSGQDGWVVVHASHTANFAKRVERVRINSALVFPETSSALVRALQSEDNAWGLRLPYENCDYQINTVPYQLVGWLRYLDGDLRFDENDPFRYDIGRTHVIPGSEITQRFGLLAQFGRPQAWNDGVTGEIIFRYEAWCDEPSPGDEYDPRHTRSNGYRLWVRIDKLRDFLAESGFDLICEIQVEREIKKELGGAHDSGKKEKTHNKIILCRPDGSIADAKGSYGTWTSVGQRAGGSS